MASNDTPRPVEPATITVTHRPERAEEVDQAAWVQTDTESWRLTRWAPRAGLGSHEPSDSTSRYFRLPEETE